VKVVGLGHGIVVYFVVSMVVVVFPIVAGLVALVVGRRVALAVVLLELSMGKIE